MALDRKAMLMNVLNGKAPCTVADRSETEWHRALPRFRARRQVALLYAARAMLVKPLCDRGRNTAVAGRRP